MADSGEQSRWTAPRVIGMAFAGIGGLVGLALLFAGVAVLLAYAFGRGDDGYFTSGREQLDSSTYAITTEDIDLGVEEADWAPDAVLGNVRLQVEGEDPVFVGIGTDDDVERYLGSVERDELIDFHDGDADLDRHDGGAPRTPPGEQDFWVARSEGSGEQELTWDAEFGRWTAVVMSADAAKGVDVEVDAGIKLDWVIWVGFGMLLVGLLMSVGAVVVVLLLSRRPAAG